MIEVPRKMRGKRFAHLEVHDFSIARGFTLVENLVAILVLALAVAAVTSTIVYVRTMFVGASSRNELQQLVENDLAAIRQANERFSCKSGICSVGTTDTSRNSYFPDIGTTGTLSSDDTTNIQRLNNLCRGLGINGSFTTATSTGGFASELATFLPTPDSRIARSLIPASSGQIFTLVYRDSATNQFLRAVSLVPTTTSWCPNDIQ